MYLELQFLVNKNQQGYISPDQFNLIINQAQMSFLDYLLGEFQQYQMGRPQPKIAYGQNQTIRQRLTPLIATYTVLTINGTTGRSPYPADYQTTDAMYTTAKKKVRYFQQDYLDDYINDPIDPVATNPIYEIIDTGFQFYPVTLTNALLSYVKTPPTIVWAYTLDVNNRPVYDAGASVDPVWYDTDCLEIIARALAMASTNLQAPPTAQYAQSIKTQGQ